MCMSTLGTMYVSGTPRGEKASDSGELELQMIVSHSVGTGNGNQSFARTTNFLNF